jgi:hypothetical protein
VGHELRGQPVPQRAGDRRLHLVLHRHVRCVPLPVLRGEPRFPGGRQPGAQRGQLRRLERVGHAAAEQPQTGDGDVEGRPAHRVGEVGRHRVDLLAGKRVEQRDVRGQVVAPGREVRRAEPVEPLLRRRVQEQRDDQRRKDPVLLTPRRLGASLWTGPFSAGRGHPCRGPSRRRS